MTEMREYDPLEGWAIVELMGHRKLGGYVKSHALGGSVLLRVDVSDDSGPVATQFYAPAAIYCITPTSEATARALARSARPEPATRWELPERPALAAVATRHEYEDEGATEGSETF